MFKSGKFRAFIFVVIGLIIFSTVLSVDSQIFLENSIFILWPSDFFKTFIYTSLCLVGCIIFAVGFFEAIDE